MRLPHAFPPISAEMWTCELKQGIPSTNFQITLVLKFIRRFKFVTFKSEYRYFDFHYYNCMYIFKQW